MLMFAIEETDKCFGIMIGSLTEGTVKMLQWQAEAAGCDGDTNV